MQYGDPRFYKLLKEITEVYSNKSHDYGGADPLSNLRDFGWKGVVVRLGDKFHRLKNFVQQGELKVKDESVIDTLKDNAIYSLLAIILFEQEKK